MYDPKDPSCLLPEKPLSDKTADELEAAEENYWKHRTNADQETAADFEDEMNETDEGEES